MSTEQDTQAWNAYFDEFGNEPQNASQLQNFIKSSNGKHLRRLSFKNAREIFNANKGKGKIIDNPDAKDNTLLVILLCGLPGAGKSTLAKYIQQVTSGDNQQSVTERLLPSFEKDKTTVSYHHVCYDSYLIQSLNDNKDNDGNIQFDNNTWKESRDQAFIKTESLINDHLQIQSNDDYTLIFVDDNMYYRSMRYKFFKLAKQYQCGFLIAYINTNKEECIKRNDTRKGIENVSKSVIQRMSDNFQVPTDNKYKWESNNCFAFTPTNIDQAEESKETDDSNIGSFYGIINNSWSKVPAANRMIDAETQNKAREANTKNLKHQTDLKLRKAMSKWMQLIKKESQTAQNIEMSSISKKIATFRKDILSDVAKCIIDDDQELNIMIEGFQHQFNDMVSQYLILSGIELIAQKNNNDDEEKEEKKEENNWKPERVKTSNLTLNFFADTTRIYWNQTKEMKRDLWEEYLKTYKHLASINHKECTDQQRTKHVHVAIASIAMYRALKKVNNYNDDNIRGQIKGMFHSMLKTIFKGQKNKYKRSSNPWKDFSEYAYNGTKSEYGTFEPEFIRNDDVALFWNFKKCTFHEICVKNNADSVGPMLCDYDDLLASYISPWITFKREKTIACGDGVCTFRYCKNDGVKDIEDWFM